LAENVIFGPVPRRTLRRHRQVIERELRVGRLRHGRRSRWRLVFGFSGERISDTGLAQSSKDRVRSHETQWASSGWSLRQEHAERDDIIPRRYERDAVATPPEPRRACRQVLHSPWRPALVRLEAFHADRICFAVSGEIVFLGHFLARQRRAARTCRELEFPSIR